MGMIIKTAILETQKRDAETAAEYAAQFQQLQTNINAETKNRTILLYKTI